MNGLNGKPWSRNRKTKDTNSTALSSTSIVPNFFSGFTGGIRSAIKRLI